MVGAVANLIFFFFILVSIIIVGLITLTYAAHCFLTIVEDTAAGNDEIRWPDEPPTDWYGKPFFLMYLLILPIASAAGVILLSGSEVLEGPLGSLPFLLGVTWLLFPLCLWSSLGAGTSWLVVHFGMYRRVFRHPGLLVLFYLLTAPILIISVALIYYGITFSTWLLLPVTALAGSALLFIYGRLLGRIAWKACQGMPGRKKKKKKRLRGVVSHDPWAGPPEDVQEAAPAEGIVATPPPSKKQVGKPAAAITAIDPWAIPQEAATTRPAPVSFSEPEEEDEWAPNKKPYGLANDAAADPPSQAIPNPKALADVDEEDEWTPNKKPYALQGDVGVSEDKSQPDPVRRLPGPDEEEDEWTPNKKPYGFQREESKRPAGPQDTRITAQGPQREEGVLAAGDLPPAPDAPADVELPKPSRLDMQIYLEPYQPFVPRWTLFSGVWEFPFYATSVSAMATVAILAFVLGLLIRFLLALWPF